MTIGGPAMTDAPELFDLVREFFPEATDREAEVVLWEVGYGLTPDPDQLRHLLQQRVELGERLDSLGVPGGGSEL